MPPSKPVFLAIILAATITLPAAAQQAKSSGLPAECGRVPALQDSILLLTANINTDRQIIANFGFDRTVADFERAAALPQAQVLEGTANIKKLLFENSMREARAKIGAQIKSGAADLALTAGKLQLTQDVQRLVGGQIEIRTREDLEKVVGALENAQLGYNTVDGLKQQQMLETAVSLAHELAVAGLEKAFTGGPRLSVAGTPWIGLALSFNEWAWMLAYRSAEAVYTVSKLTEATVGDLQLLKERSATLRKNVDHLVRLRGDLLPLSRTCDSSKLARKKSVGKNFALIMGTAVGGGLALAALIPKEETGGDSGICISERNCIVSVFSSSCSCAGSVYGRCDWTGATSGPGGRCEGGLPCQEGLSCNNGRCESSGGRCPF